MAEHHLVLVVSFRCIKSLVAIDVFNIRVVGGKCRYPVNGLGITVTIRVIKILITLRDTLLRKAGVTVIEEVIVRRIRLGCLVHRVALIPGKLFNTAQEALPSLIYGKVSFLSIT